MNDLLIIFIDYSRENLIFAAEKLGKVTQTGVKHLGKVTQTGVKHLGKVTFV